MSQDTYIGVVVMFAGTFAPRGFMFCQGQLLSISANTALFSILGTTYGGNGQTNFALPDLRGRAPIGAGQGPGLPNISLGEMAGAPSATLTIAQMPQHNHTCTVTINASNDGRPGSDSPAGNYLDSTGGTNIFTSGTDGTTMNAGMAAATVGQTGNTQPFSIQDPYLGMNYIICTEGVFPSRN